MRKVVMLSAAAILGIASIAVSQAEDVAGPSVTVTDVAEAQEVVENVPQKLGNDTQAAAVTTESEVSPDEAAQVDGAAVEETAAAAPPVRPAVDSEVLTRLVACLLHAHCIARRRHLGGHLALARVGGESIPHLLLGRVHQAKPRRKHHAPHVLVNLCSVKVGNPRLHTGVHQRRDIGSGRGVLLAIDVGAAHRDADGHHANSLLRRHKALPPQRELLDCHVFALLWVAGGHT